MALTGYQFLVPVHLDTTAFGAGSQTNFIIPLTEKSFNPAVVDLIMANCLDSGYDFRVTDDGGSSFLPYQLVSWDNENKTFEVHFKTTADVYNVAIDFDLYGRKSDATDESSNIWTNYEGVFHVGEESSPAINSANAAQPAAWSGNVIQGNAVVGKGARLDGAGDYININNEGTYDYTGSALIEAWFRVEAFTDDWQTLLAKGSGSWKIRRNDGNNAMTFDCAGITNAQGDTPVNDDKWHHVVGVYDGATSKLYIDGELDQSVSTSGNIDTSGDNPKIGRDVDNPGRDWQGWVDEVRLSANTGGWYTAQWAKLTYELGYNPLKYFSTPSRDVLDLGWHRKAKIDVDISAQISSAVTNHPVPFKLTGKQYPELFAGKYKAMPDGSDLIALPTGSTGIDDLLNIDVVTFENPTVDAGTTDGTTANKLVDSTQDFLTTVQIGDIVWRKADDALALVTAVDLNTALSLDSDIMVSGDAYLIIRGLAAFYVKIPDDLDTAARSIDLYWSRGATTHRRRSDYVGGYANTWDSDAAVVSHLQQASGQNEVDASAYNATGVQINTPAQLAGKFAKYCRDLEAGSAERFSWPNRTRFGLAATGFTFSGWINVESYGSARIFIGRREGSNEGWECKINTSGKIQIDLGGSSNQIITAGATVLSTTTWYFVQVTYDGAFPPGSSPWPNIRIWIDGTEESYTYGGNAFTGFVDPNKNLSFGSRNGTDATQDFDGQIEAYKWSKIERSDDWLEVEYKLMDDVVNNDSAAYYTFNASVAVGNVAYTSGWAYEVELDINSAYSETSFLSRITEAVSSIPGDIWAQAQTDGRDIRVTQNGAYVPIHVVRWDPVNMKMQIMASINPQDPYTLRWGSTNYESSFVIDSGYGQYEAYDEFYLALWHGGEESGSVAYDSTRKQLHGSYVGTMPDFQGTDPETRQDFNGTSDGVNIPDDDILDMVVGVPFILESIFKFKTVDSTNVRQLVAKQQDEVGRWELQLNGGRPEDKDGLLRFSLRSGAISERIHADDLAEADVWYHCVGIRDAAGLCKLYINGVEQTETLAFNYDLSNAADASIGYKPFGTDHAWADILLEETRITKYSSRSEDYIKMTDENFRTPDVFYGLALENNLRGNLKSNLLGEFQ